MLQQAITSMLKTNEKSFSTETENIKNNQIEIKELKNIKSRTKSFLDGLNKRKEWTQERISEAEDRTIP